MFTHFDTISDCDKQWNITCCTMHGIMQVKTRLGHMSITWRFARIVQNLCILELHPLQTMCNSASDRHTNCTTHDYALQSSWLCTPCLTVCQKLSDLVDVWRSYDKNNFACFSETWCENSLDLLQTDQMTTSHRLFAEEESLIGKFFGQRLAAGVDTVIDLRRQTQLQLDLSTQLNVSDLLIESYQGGMTWN